MFVTVSLYLKRLTTVLVKGSNLWLSMAIDGLALIRNQSRFVMISFNQHIAME